VPAEKNMLSKYWTFYLNFFKSLINNKDPEQEPDL